MKPFLRFLSGAIFIFCILIFQELNAEKPAKNDLTHWPAGCTPTEIGSKVAKNYLETPFRNFSGQAQPTPFIRYPETCTWYGALTFAQESGDKELAGLLATRFDPLLGDESSKIPPANHVDNTVFGAVPLELYIQTHEQKYLSLGLDIADKQWAEPDPKVAKPWEVDYFKRGLTPQTRLWIDDMFMVTAVQAQAFRATGDKKYIERAAREMVVYLDSLQRPNGLFFHAPDVPFFWGRGNGWMAAGMAELLRSLPEKNPDYPRIMKGYKTMMASLLKYQDKDGMWRQLVDDPESWPETSCTGMFTFAIITGVKNGWLDKKVYTPAARKGWLALISYLDDKNDMKEICEGTNKRSDHQYYLDRKRLTGDFHGQAPVLWCATALLRK
jgi:unsaturated rhamnogalacturonyl hydrolase